MSRIVLTIALVLRACFATSLCPALCTATVDGTSFPCRYHANDCMVNVTSSGARLHAEDINLAIISPYVGDLGDLMTMVEPAIAQALQDIEDSNFLPGFRLNGYVVDSQCTVSGAIVAAVTSQNTAPPKHLIFGDSCSEGCEMVNDAMRFYNVMQAGQMVRAQVKRMMKIPFLKIAYWGWTKFISHHLETMGSHCLLVFAGESSFQGSLGGAGFRPSTVCCVCDL